MTNQMNEKGVTLTELMIVLGIIALMAGISVPYFIQGRGNAALRGAARTLATDLIWARSQAVDRVSDYCVEFDLAAKQYTIRPSPAGCAPGGTVERAVILPDLYPKVSFGTGTGVAGDPEGLGLGITPVTFSSNNITFDYLGRSVNGGAVDPGVIYLTHAETKRTYAVTVGGTSGRTKVYRWNNDQWQ